MVSTLAHAAQYWLCTPGFHGFQMSLAMYVCTLHRDPLKVPTLHIVYSTLKDHHRISRLQASVTCTCTNPCVVMHCRLFQNVEVEKLVRSMKDLKLIPHCWQSSDFPDHSPSPRTSPGRPIGRRGLDASPSPSRSVGRRSLDTPTSELGGGAVKKRKSPSSEKVTHQQVMKLREYFSNITMSPVKQVQTS